MRLEPEARRVVVGPRAALAVREALVGELNWLAPGFAGPMQAKIRSMARPAPATFDGATLRFAAPEYGVAPGQAAVLYAGERVLGGGWIEETVPARALAA